MRNPSVSFTTVNLSILCENYNFFLIGQEKYKISCLIFNIRNKLYLKSMIIDLTD